MDHVPLLSLIYDDHEHRDEDDDNRVVCVDYFCTVDARTHVLVCFFGSHHSPTKVFCCCVPIRRPASEQRDEMSNVVM